MGRFLNADAFTSTGQGLLGNNMFTYCLNNPVSCSDSQGTRPVSILERFGDKSIPVPNQKRVKKEATKKIDYKSIGDKAIRAVDAVLTNIDVSVGVGLGMSGNVDALDVVDLEVGIRYDLISVGYQDGHFYCQQECFTGIDGTILVVFDYDFYSENKVRQHPFSKDFGPWEEDTSNDIWTISGGSLYLVGGARYHIGLDILSLIDDIKSIF